MDNDKTITQTISIKKDANNQCFRVKIINKQYNIEYSNQSNKFCNDESKQNKQKTRNRL